MSSGRKWISFLDEGSLTKIDEASLRLLDKTGIVVHDPELRVMLTRAGARVDADQCRVRLPSEIVRKDGGGVHHLAFEVEDIDEAVTQRI